MLTPDAEFVGQPPEFVDAERLSDLSAAVRAAVPVTGSRPDRNRAAIASSVTTDPTVTRCPSTPNPASPAPHQRPGG